MEEYIEEIIEYLQMHALEGIKIEEVAEHFGYSKFHFSREFKKLTGLAPNEYVTGVKMGKGIDSLLEGQSVTDTQLDSGYSSSGTFTTTFTKNTGLSPRTYAKNINQLFEIVKSQETVNEDADSLFYRNPDYPTVVAPYKLTVYLDIPEGFEGLVFSGLFLKPNPNTSYGQM